MEFFCIWLINKQSSEFVYSVKILHFKLGYEMYMKCMRNEICPHVMSVKMPDRAYGTLCEKENIFSHAVHVPSTYTYLRIYEIIV